MAWSPWGCQPAGTLFLASQKRPLGCTRQPPALEARQSRLVSGPPKSLALDTCPAFSTSPFLYRTQTSRKTKRFVIRPGHQIWVRTNIAWYDIPKSIIFIIMVRSMICCPVSYFVFTALFSSATFPFLPAFLLLHFGVIRLTSTYADDITSMQTTTSQT